MKDMGTHKYFTEMPQTLGSLLERDEMRGRERERVAWVQNGVGCS